jgi:hypothetical protein
MGAVGSARPARTGVRGSVCRANRVHAVLVELCCCLRRAGGILGPRLMCSSLAYSLKLAGAASSENIAISHVHLP